MTDAPERIWARKHHHGSVEAVDYKIDGEQEYVRADVPRAAVEAAYIAGLGEAAARLEPKNPRDDWTDFAKQHHADAIEMRALAADKAHVRAAVAKLMEGRG